MADGLFRDLPATTPRRARKVRPGIPAGQSLSTPWPLDGTINVVLFAGMGGARHPLDLRRPIPAVAAE